MKEQDVKRKTNYMNVSSGAAANQRKRYSMRTISGKTLAAVGVILGLASSSAALADMGRTAGNYGVSPSGAATYSIPIWVQPGPNGVTPSLAFNYSSDSGNGTMGMGWSLAGGFSSIDRCPKSLLEDGVEQSVKVDATDRFCLNGNKLRITSGPLSSYGTTGAVYQTQVADFSRITSVGTSGLGPQSFIVHSKDGLIYEYGNTADSRHTLVGPTVYRWLLNKVSDRNGNSYIVTYTTDNTVGKVPASVQWGPTSAGASTYQYKAAFLYELKANPKDAVMAMQWGVSVVLKLRLSRVEIGYSASGSTHAIKRQYGLDYEFSPTTGQSRLTSVTECGATTSECLKPTLIAYQNGAEGLGTAPKAYSPGNTVMGGRVDYNGDGKSDTGFFNGSTWRVQFSTGAGFSSAVDTGMATTPYVGKFVAGSQDGFLTNVSGTWRYTAYNGVSFTTTSTGTPAVAGTFLVDYNGDGLRDLLWLETSGSNRLIRARMNLTTGAATVPTFSSTVTTLFNSASISTSIANFTLSTTSSCPLERQCDINGDGGADLQILITTQTNCGFSGCTITTTGYDLLSSSPNGYIVANATNGVVITFLGLRFNDDRCIDTIPFSATTLRVSNCGNGTFTNVTLPALPRALMDWDGDGNTDLLSDSGGMFRVYRATGSLTTPFEAPVTTLIPYSASCSYFTADYDGDGLDELACFTSTSITYYTHNGGGSAGTTGGSGVYATQIPDLAINITDGYGMAASPAYVSTAQSNYTKGTNTALPLIDDSVPKIVVGKVTFSDGIGASYDVTYTYMGARRQSRLDGSEPPGTAATISAADARNGQSVGFEQVSVVDSRNSLLDRTTYEQSFPLSGMVKKKESFQSDQTTPISIETVTNLSEPLDSTTNNKRYFPYSSSISADGFEVGGPLNGVLVNNTLHTFGYSSFTYGNLTTETTVVTDKDYNAVPSRMDNTWKVVVTNAYDSPLTNGSDWCVAFLSQKQIAMTSTAAGVNPVTRTVGYTADSGNPSKCRVKTKTTEPSSTKYKIVETYAFDAFGNVSGVQITGRQPVGTDVYGDMPTRSSSVGWGTTGQFPETSTDPSGDTRVFVYNLDSGTLKESFDANSTSSNIIKTSYLYDGFGRKIRETSPDGTYTTWSYEDCATAGCVSGLHRLTVAEKKFDKIGGVITDRFTYSDALDRPVVVRSRLLNGPTWNGTYQWIQTEYDSFGRVRKQFMPCTSAAVATSCSAAATTKEYDTVSRLTKSSRPRNQNDNTLVSSTTAYIGRTVVSTDTQGKSSTRVVNVDGTVREIRDANNFAVTFSSDAAGSVTQVTDSSGATRLSGVVYEYGIKPFQVDVTDSAIGHVKRVYNSLGELIAWTDAKGQNFAATYDSSSRPLTRLEPDAATSTTWQWGNDSSAYNRGQLVKAESKANGVVYSETYTFDDRTRTKRKSIVIPDQGTFNYDWTYEPQSGFLDVLTYPESTPGFRLSLKYAYQNGSLKSVSDADNSSSVFWTAVATNSWGQTTQEGVGTNLLTVRAFDTVTSWLSNIQTGPTSNPTDIQNLSYLYDDVGNITQRQNNKLGLTETFYYGGDTDNLYRLGQSTLNNGSTTTTNLSLKYDLSGSITKKTEVGVADSLSDQTIAYTTYNYPSQITVGAQSASFAYGPNRQRWQMSFNDGTITQKTYYIGGLLEKVDIGNSTVFRHTIMGGTGTAALYNRASGGGSSLLYVFDDNQSSVESFVDSSTGVVTHAAFSAYGLRRDANTWSGDPANRAALDDITRQGYTYQTALGSMGLNHMNGRVQDAATGRFISADPKIDCLGSTQGFNRYAYVKNNPMTFTDPTGFGRVWVSRPCPETVSLYCPGNGAMCTQTVETTRKDCGYYIEVPDAPGPSTNPGPGGAPAGGGGGDRPPTERERDCQKLCAKEADRLANLAGSAAGGAVLGAQFGAWWGALAGAGAGLLAANAADELDLSGIEGALTESFVRGVLLRQPGVDAFGDGVGQVVQTGANNGQVPRDPYLAIPSNAFGSVVMNAILRGATGVVRAARFGAAGGVAYVAGYTAVFKLAFDKCTKNCNAN